MAPGLAAIGGLVNASLFVGAKQMAEHGNVDYIRIFWIDDDTRDRLRVLETHLGKGFACIRRLVDAVSKTRTLAIVRLAGSHPDDIWVRWRDRYVASRRRRIRIEDRREGRAIIRRLIDATSGQTDIINVRIALDGGDVINTPSHARRTDAAKH